MYATDTDVIHHTQAQNSPFPQIFSTIVCWHPPTLTAFSDYTGPDLLCSTVFHF